MHRKTRRGHVQVVGYSSMYDTCSRQQKIEHLLFLVGRINDSGEFYEFHASLKSTEVTADELCAMHNVAAEMRKVKNHEANKRRVGVPAFPSDVS